MKFSRFVCSIVSIFFLLSCQNNSAEKTDVNKKENQHPTIESRKSEKSFPKLEREKPTEKSLDKEVKKKRLRAQDTLRPVVAVL